MENEVNFIANVMEAVVIYTGKCLSWKVSIDAKTAQTLYAFGWQ